jgi:DNA-binding NtrC family response regulator
VRIQETEARNQNAHGLVGRSAAMEQVRRLIDKASRNRLPVLLLGASGTGKEVVARAIHNSNPRGQLVPIDCGSLVGTLMESELFGHVKGAFSGAIENKKGLVELANGGTAFFDEIGDLPLEMQVKLLRLIQEREYRAVGALRWNPVDLRIIAATHRDLKAEVAAGRFRQDLFYRLNVFVIHLPPLADRKEDIPLLVERFLGESGCLPGPEISATLMAYDWPGNVRELKNCIERMRALESEGVMQMADMPSALQCHLAAGSCMQSNGEDTSGLQTLSEAVEEGGLPLMRLPARSKVISLADSEKGAIANALAATNGERAQAARLLKIGRTTLYRKMKEYGFD